MAHSHFVKKARKNYKEHGIKKGDSYYWWKFRYGGKHMSKTAPSRSQLTQSEYLSQVYDLIDSVSLDDVLEAESYIQDIISQLDEIRENCQERFDNIPEQLQEGDAGNTLQERIDACESAISELESIDTEVESFDDWVIDNCEKKQSKAEKNEAYEEYLEEKCEEVQEEIINALEGIQI